MLHTCNLSLSCSCDTISWIYSDQIKLLSLVFSRENNNIRQNSRDSVKTRRIMGIDDKMHKD